MLAYAESIVLVISLFVRDHIDCDLGSGTRAVSLDGLYVPITVMLMGMVIRFTSSTAL